jgi:hypothetical protein
MSRLTETYTAEVVPALIKQFGYSSAMAVPRVTKVVVNMGIGDAIQDGKAMDAAVEELAGISGQKPTVTRARKSIANFKLREDGDRVLRHPARQAHVRVPRAADQLGSTARTRLRGAAPRVRRRGNTRSASGPAVPEVNLAKVRGQGRRVHRDDVDR